MGNRPQVLLRLFGGQTDPGVGDHQNLLLPFLPSLDSHFQRSVCIVQRLPLHLGETHLLECVGGIRDEFSEKDVLRGVNRVNEYVEELLDLRLKGVTLRGCVGGHVPSLSHKN